MTSIRRYARKAGVKFKAGRKKNSPRIGTFAVWIKKHPEVILPKSPKEMAKISGCTVDSVKSYICRQRRKAKKLIASKPWANDGDPVIWKDIRNHKISDKSFMNVHGLVSSSGRMKFIIRLKDGSTKVFLMTTNQLEKLYDRTKP